MNNNRYKPYFILRKNIITAGHHYNMHFQNECTYCRLNPQVISNNVHNDHNPALLRIYSSEAEA